jgi:hypothetical protein
MQGMRLARVTPLIPAVAIVLAMSLAPSAQAQSEVVATVDGVTPVAAFGGRQLWSVRGATGDWSLVTRAGGVTSVVPVRPRRVAFDADLGPGPAGSVVAAYSRCRTDPPSGSGGTLYNRGRGCDIHLFDFATGRERRLANASAPDATEFHPTVWRDTIAFARVYDRKPDLPYVYTRPLEGEAPSTRQPGGARRACRRNPSTGRTECSDGTLSRPDGLELWGRRLAFSWTFLAFAEGLESEIRLDTIGGGHRVVAHQDGGGLTQVRLGWPGFDDGRVYWVASCLGDGSGCPGRYGLRRLRISTGLIERAPAPSASLAHDRDADSDLLLVDAQPGADCLGDPAVPGGTCVIRAERPAFG